MLPRRIFKLADKEAPFIMRENCAFYDKVRGILTSKCGHCGYMLSSVSMNIFEVPEHGKVCELCYHMHESLQHPGLKNVFYFRNAHEDWKKNNGSDPTKRNRMGL